MNDVENRRALKPPLADLLTTERAAMVVAVVTVLRVVTLYAANTNLSVDEAQYWSWSRDLAFGYYSKPPLLAWIIRLTTEIFGHSEAAVRLASPLLHAATAFVLMHLARRLFDERIAAWTAVVWITIPAVSLSATLISTDVPLLFAWSCALVFLFQLVDRPRWSTALFLGLAIGLGLNAKYAMAYFPVCVLLMALTSRTDRWLAVSPRLWTAFAIAAILIAPNIMWNASNEFVTFSHVEDNIGWRAGDLFHPARALEFFAAQFGVYGPLAFAALIVVLWRSASTGVSDNERRLLWLSVPVIVLITVQALLSKAYANWAAVAYPAATIVVIALLLRRRWMLPTVIIGGGAVLVFLVTPIFAPQINDMTGLRPYKRLLGYDDMAEIVRQRATEAGARTIVTTRRYEAAELLYYLRDSDFDIRILHPPGTPPLDHFALTRPWSFEDGVGGLILVAGPGPANANADGVDSPIEWQDPFAVSPGVDRTEMMRTGIIVGKPAAP